MKTRFTMTMAVAALAALALAGCANGSGGAGGGYGSSGGYGSGGSDTSTTAAPPPAASGADLAVADSSLGKIVVDGTGMTAYYYDKDTAGATASACSGQCATLWPAIETTADTPKVDGVTGTVGTITANDGGKQITINGMPIYTYASDSAAGDVNGQGVGGVWWVIAPSGEKVTTMP